MSTKSGWQELPLNRFIRLRSGDFIAADDIEAEGRYPVYGGNGFRGFTDSFNTVGPLALVGRQGAHCGNVHVADGHIWVSEHALRCFPEKELDPRWLAYSLQDMNLNQYSVSAAQPGLSVDNLKHLRTNYPPLETQQRIARFLDAKTARIDGLIEKKRALLDRLAEKRQALITRAVTKGLNPDAPMKSSGIDWLGDIPAHWGVRRLKSLTLEPLSYGANAAAEFEERTWPRFVRITDVDELGRLRDETFRSLPPDVAEPYLLQTNDILLARSGATVGKSFIYEDSWGVACYAGYLIRARIAKEYSAKFIYWFLNSSAYWEWVGANFIQSTIQNISADRYAGIALAVPPNMDEQQRIIDTVDSSCRQLDMQSDKVRCSIERLEEYRAAIITAAVTGQMADLV